MRRINTLHRPHLLSLCYTFALWTVSQTAGKITDSTITPTTTPRRYLWDVLEVETEYDPTSLNTFDENEDYGESTTTTLTGESTSIDWLETFSTVCEMDYRKDTTGDTTRALIDILKCSDNRRIMPFECSRETTDAVRVRCSCSTLYGVEAVAPDGRYIYESFILLHQNATVSQVLAGAERCLPDLVTLEIILQYNQTLSNRHDVSIRDEAIWLTTQIQLWLADSSISTISIAPSVTFEYSGALVVNGSECESQTQAWFTRWQIVLSVHSALFEQDFLALYRLVSARSLLNVHNHAHRVLRICLLPVRNVASHTGDYASLYCSSLPFAETPRVYGYTAESLCQGERGQYRETSRGSTTRSTTISTTEQVENDNDVWDDEEYDTDLPTKPELKEKLEQESENEDLENEYRVLWTSSSPVAPTVVTTTTSKPTTIRTAATTTTRTARTSTKSTKKTVPTTKAVLVSKLAISPTPPSVAKQRLETVAVAESLLPDWLLVTIILASAFLLVFLSALVTCYVLQQRRKNKGSYKIHSFNQRTTRASNNSIRKITVNAPQSPIPRSNAGLGNETFVSLSEPLMHDYATGPPPPEFLA